MTKAPAVAILVITDSYWSMKGCVDIKSIAPKTSVRPLVRRYSRVNGTFRQRRQPASRMIATREPAIAALTPSVAVRIQKTIKGPNSERTKRRKDAMLAMARALDSD